MRGAEEGERVKEGVFKELLNSHTIRAIDSLTISVYLREMVYGTNSFVSSLSIRVSLCDDSNVTSLQVQS